VIPFTLLAALTLSFSEPHSGQLAGCVAEPVQPGGRAIESRLFEASLRRTHDALEDAMQAAGVLLYESSDSRMRGERVVKRVAILGLPKGNEMIVGRLEAANRDGRPGTLVLVETLRQGGKTGEPKQSWSRAILDGTGCLLTTLVGADSRSNHAAVSSSPADPGDSREISLAGGTSVPLLLRRYWEYDDLQFGKKISFEAASDVAVGADVLIRRGSFAQATVTGFVDAKPGFWKTEAPKALMRFDYVTAVGGERVPISGEVSMQLKNYTPMMNPVMGAALRAGTRFEATVVTDQHVRVGRQ
jgi:hypothetical protein